MTRTRVGRMVLAMSMVISIALVSGCSLAKEATSSPAQQSQAAAAPAQNNDQMSVLDVVQKRGKVLVGIGLGNPPWGSYDKNNQPMGFDVDVANAVAKELGVQLEIVPTEATNRIPYLLTGKADVIISSFAATPERAKSVAFTQPYAPYKVVLLGRKSDTSIKSYKDLAGHTVAVVRGTTQDTMLTAIAPQGTNIVRYEDDPSATLAFQQNKAETLAQGEVALLYLAKSNPDYEIKGVIGQTFPAMAVRRGDQDWLNWLNVFLMNYGSTGKLAAMYEARFGVPFTTSLPQY